MTRDFGGERVVAQGAADGARRRVERGGEELVTCDFAGGDLKEEGVDALFWPEIAGSGGLG